MEQKTAQRKTALSRLPGIAFATLASTGLTVAICLGEALPLRVNSDKTAEELNRQYGVTPAQARAMLAGMLLGWRSSLADPDIYDDNGQLRETPPDKSPRA